jgi:hypothetical protein
MKFFGAFRVGIVLLAAFALAPQAVWACACCADDGEYRLSVATPSADQVSLMKRIRFGDKATLFMGPGEIEDYSKGLLRPAESYGVSGSLMTKTWKLSFLEGKDIGALNLLLPAKFVSYGADIHDGARGGGGGPLLYKEWRFEGVVFGSGVFRPGLTAAAKYFLVLQGRGNNCDNAEDFTHWRLEIRGSKASYAFVGNLAKPKS